VFKSTEQNGPSPKKRAKKSSSKVVANGSGTKAVKNALLLFSRCDKNSGSIRLESYNTTWGKIKTKSEVKMYIHKLYQNHTHYIYLC